MKMKITLFCIACIITCVSHKLSAQSPDWQWAKSVGGINDEDSRSVSTDAGGNVYITGRFMSSSITFDTTTLTNAGSGDIFIVKYDSSGNVLWAKSIGGAGYEQGLGISSDINGNVYLTGSFGSTSLTIDTTTLANSGGQDIIVVKYNSLGNVLWVRSSGGSSWDVGNSISTDANGNIFITGYFGTSITFETTTLTSVGNNDIFVAKYDSSGNAVWAKSAGGTSLDNGSCINADINGNVFVSGYFASSFITFGTTILTNSGSRDTYIVKYDSSGNIIWAKSAGGTGLDGSSSISSDINGNVYVTGIFASPSISFETTTLTNASIDTLDIFIVKYDASGNVIWAKSIGGNKDEESGGISVDTNENVYLVGSFLSLTLSLQSATITNTGGTDIFIIKFDSLGNELFTKSTYGAYDDWSYSVSADNYGNALIAGRFKSSSVIFGTTTLINTDNSGSTDEIFVAKLGNNITETNIIEKNNDFLLYPNPSKGKLVIENINFNLIEIYNISGEKIYHSANKQLNSLMIDISNVPVGIYFYKILSTKHILSTGKIIIQ